MTNTKRTILEATEAEKAAANAAYDTAAEAVWAEHFAKHLASKGNYAMKDARQEAHAAGRAAYVETYATFGVILNTVN